MILQVFKQYWSTITIAILALILFFSIDGYNTNRQRLNDLKTTYRQSDSLAKSLIEKWKDENGKLHATVENLKSQGDIKIKEVDSISSLLKIKPKQVIAYSQTSSKLQVDEKLQVDSTTQIILCPEDSIQVVKQYDFTWKDNWMNIKGSVGQIDSIHVTGYDTITKTDYWKRKWILGAKSYYSDIQNSNPHIETTGYKGVQFAGKEKQWSLGIDAQIGYPLNQPIKFNQPVFSLGISVQRTFLRF